MYAQISMSARTAGVSSAGRKKRNKMTEAYDLVVEQGRIWSPTASYVADVAVKDGRIVAIGGPFATAARRVDARGLDVLPGLWHVHCHFREPGHTYKEDFESGSRAAASRSEEHTSELQSLMRTSYA